MIYVLSKIIFDTNFAVEHVAGGRIVHSRVYCLSLTPKNRLRNIFIIDFVISETD